MILSCNVTLLARKASHRTETTCATGAWSFFSYCLVMAGIACVLTVKETAHAKFLRQLGT